MLRMMVIVGIVVVETRLDPCLGIVIGLLAVSAAPQLRGTLVEILAFRLFQLGSIMVGKAFKELVAELLTVLVHEVNMLLGIRTGITLIFRLIVSRH
jgi:energy-converting hydrogenase Eha subunit E